MNKKVEERDIKLIEKYGIKNEKCSYKNMTPYTIWDYDDSILELSFPNHVKLTIWEGTDNIIKIRYDAPEEIIGVTVRYAFSRCKGNGPYAKGAEIVTKALFPEGVPNSLKEYLESVDKDYRKWLIANN